MKTLIIAAFIISSQFISAQASSLPLPPYDKCKWVTNQSVSCQDTFGNTVNCVLRQTQNVIRWSCL